MKTAIQRINPNARMSQAVVHNGTAYLSGAVAKNYGADIAQQTEEALADIDTTLTKLGTDRSRLLSAQILLRDIDRDFGAMNVVCESWIPANAAPSRATWQANMADPAILIEIIVTAAV